MDEERFISTVMPLRDMMYGLGLHLGLTESDSADMVQETFLSLWDHRRDLAKSDNPRGYCMRAFRNKCLSQLRDPRRWVGIEDIGERGDQPESKLEQEQRRVQIERLISRLPADQERALRLSAYGEWENSAIAEEMGTTEVNIRQLLSRGRRKLREWFKEIER